MGFLTEPKPISPSDVRSIYLHENKKKWYKDGQIGQKSFCLCGNEGNPLK